MGAPAQQFAERAKGDDTLSVPAVRLAHEERQGGLAAECV